VKVLVVHPGVDFSVGDVYNGVVAGLKANGHDVGVFNLSDRIEFFTRAHVKRDDGTYTKSFSDDAAMQMATEGIEVVLYEWWPEVVIIVSGFYIPPKLWGVLARRPVHVVYWCTESPYEDDRQMRAARYADTVILNDPTNLDEYRRQVNARTFYLPHSYDPALHFPGDADPELACDFAFVGTGFPSRITWLERVIWDGVDAKLGGNWQQVDDGSPLLPLLLHPRGECMDNADTAKLYRSAKVSLNLYRKEHSDHAHADGWAMGPREVELAACGTFFFRESRPEGDDLFPSLPILEDPETFSRDLRWWLTHDDERNAAAAEALGAIADRTFKNTAARLLDLVERAGTKIAA
jgi:spore maturation protein CgeB